MEHENPEKFGLNYADFNNFSVFKPTKKAKNIRNESILDANSAKKAERFNPFPSNKKNSNHCSNFLNIAYLEDTNENDMNDSCTKEILKNLNDVKYEKTLESFLKKDFKLVIAETAVFSNLISYINHLTDKHCVTELYYSNSTKVLFLVFNSQLDLFGYTNSTESFSEHRLNKDNVKYTVLLNNIDKTVKLTPFINILSCGKQTITIDQDNLNLKCINIKYIKQESFLSSNLKIPYMETFSIIKFINWIFG